MTAIEWTDEVWNPVVGCSKVSPGCAHCYAETVHKARLGGRHGYPTFAPWTPENAEHNVTLMPHKLDEPLKWKKPRRVFVNSMSDLFHERLTGLPSESARTQDRADADQVRFARQEGEPPRPDFIAEVFAVMSIAEQHTFQVLTKRPKAMALLLGHPNFWLQVNAARMKRGVSVIQGGMSDLASGRQTLPNIWLGTSVENERFADRAEWLSHAPARVRFVSAEPLLGPLPSLRLAEQDDSPRAPEGAGIDEVLRYSNARKSIRPGIDWLIVGGESGARHRRIDGTWVRDLRDRANAAGTAFFFKQWGGRTPKANGRELDGRTWDEFPAPMQDRMTAGAIGGERG